MLKISEGKTKISQELNAVVQETPYNQKQNQINTRLQPLSLIARVFLKTKRYITKSKNMRSSL